MVPFFKMILNFKGMQYTISDNHPLSFATNDSILDLDMFGDDSRVEEAMKYLNGLPYKVGEAINGLDYLQLLSEHTTIFYNFGTVPLNTSFNTIISRRWMKWQMDLYAVMITCIQLKISLNYDGEYIVRDSRITNSVLEKFSE